MRFYFGLSKRITLKNLFKIALMLIGGLLAFFGINNMTVLALEDGFTNRNIANIKYCTGAGVSDPNTSCDASSSTYQNTNSNGVIDSMAPIGVENSDTRRIPNAKTLFWIYSGVSQTGTNNPCNNPNTLSFNVTLSLNDLNNVLADNELNPNSYTGPPSPVITSIREAVLSFTRKSYSNSSTYYQYTGVNNSVGVFAGFRTGSGQGQIRNQTNCSFVSYGSKKSVNFRCSLNATLPSNSLYIGINYKNTSYLNNSSLYSNLRIYDAIKVQEINDPCNNNYASDSQGIVDSINGQSGQIAQNTQDIIDNQNNINDNITDFKNNNHQDMEDLKDKADALEGVLDDTNDKLDDIKDGIEQSNKNTESCSIIKGFDNFSFSSTGILNNDGTIRSSSSSWKVTDYYKIGNNSNAMFKTENWNDVNYCVYDVNKSLISCYSYPRIINSFFPLTIDDGGYYVKLSVVTYANMEFKRCSGIGQTLTDYMNDEGIDDSFVPEGIRDITDLIDNEPEIIQDLIQLPVKFLRTVYDNVSSDSCSAYTVDVPFFDGNTYHWNFTCPNYNDLIGETPTTILDAIICFILIFGIAKMGVRVYEDLSSAKDTFDEIYKGGH